MKKIFTFSAIVSLFAVLVSLAGCTTKELDVDPMGETFSFAGVAPNPVMRGGALRIFGRSLDQVSEVRFAGDVSVTEFVKLSQGAKLDTLEVIVPLEGPEVGKVTLVAKDGRVLTSQADLTFTEPIKIESFSPASVLSGEVITFKGEYLNAVKEIFFSGEDAVSVAFESQSRHELKVKLPANAVSGPVILSDVNEIEDEKSIPNHIYTETDLVVGDPVVTKAEKKATYKSGDVITVVGEHLDMIKNVALPQVAEVEFTLAEDAKSISFNLPPKASDGNITLTSYAGKNFDAGEIETVNVTELSVKSLAEDGRYKAGVEVEISGSDLDLVTKVEFTGAEASWYAQDNKIIAVQPAEAQDGAITVTLESGKKAYSDDLEVVKPVITAIEAPETIVAGQTEVTLIGTDLDLVVSVKMGNEEQSFIDCEFDFDVDEEENLIIVVEIPEQAYSGPITVTSAAGYESSTEKLDVTYDMAVSIQYASSSFALGQNIAFTGKNLMQIEQVFIKGKKVTNFVQRADDAMAFALPDKLGPGVYRLDLVLIDGTELTWPVPFEVTAPFTETYIWQGSATINGWAGVTFGDDRFIWQTLGAKEGDLVRIYYTAPESGWWDLQLVNGCWTNLSLAELGGGNEIKQDAGFPGGSQIFTFEITEAVLATLNEDKGWGGAFIINGDGNVEVTGISLIQFGASEKKTVIWEGSSTVTWSGGAVSALAYGGFDWSTVEAGTKLSVVYTIDDPDGCIRIGVGNWASIPSLAPLAEDGNLPLTEGGLTVELTAEDIASLIAGDGMVVCGTGYTVTEIALVTVESAGPQEKTIWEGSSTVTWSGGAVSALAYGGYDWSTVEAGTKLCAHYTIDDPDGCIRFGAGNWASIPSLAPLAEDGNLPLQEGGHEVELTQEDIDYLVAGDGLVVCGTGYTITQIGLK